MYVETGMCVFSGVGVSLATFKVRAIIYTLWILYGHMMMWCIALCMACSHIVGSPQVIGFPFTVQIHASLVNW